MCGILQAVVKSLPGNQGLTVSVVVSGKLRNLDRPKDEILEKSLNRLQKVFVSKKKKRETEETQQAPEIPNIQLYSGPDTSFPLVDPKTTTNADAWIPDYMLKIGDVEYTVIVNPPYAEHLQSHGKAFVGIPVVPYVELLFADSCTWRWWKKKNQDSSWEIIEGAESRVYVPTDKECGFHLRVECTPLQKRMGAISVDMEQEQILAGETKYYSVGEVSKGPHSPALRRVPAGHEWTGDPTVRVISYNILADQYASTDTAKDVLFADCPNKYVSFAGCLGQCASTSVMICIGLKLVGTSNGNIDGH